jgi:hypothetical protein
MDDHSRGLVHDEHMLVLVRHAEVDVLRLQLRGLGLRQIDFEGFAARKPPALDRRCPVHAHGSGADQTLGEGPGADFFELG